MMGGATPYDAQTRVDRTHGFHPMVGEHKRQGNFTRMVCRKRRPRPRLAGSELLLSAGALLDHSSEVDCSPYFLNKHVDTAARCLHPSQLKANWSNSTLRSWKDVTSPRRLVQDDANDVFDFRYGRSINRQECDINEDQNGVIDSVITPTEPHSIIGRRHIASWKRKEGRRKSWKRCAKTMVSPAQPVSRYELKSVDHLQYAMSPLWIPSVFFHGRFEYLNRDGGKLHRLCQPKLHPDKYSATLGHCVGQNAPESLQETPLTPNEHQEDSYSAVNNLWSDAELPPYFIRLTWQNRTLVGGEGRLDRFLSSDVLLGHRWRVDGFLRNDAHADVYMVFDTHACNQGNILCSRAEAHVFLSEYHGNSATYAKRRKRAMRDSNNGETVLDSFNLHSNRGRPNTTVNRPIPIGPDSRETLVCSVQLEQPRHVMVIDVSGGSRSFRLRVTDKEYPRLPQQGAVPTTKGSLLEAHRARTYLWRNRPAP